MTVTEIRSILEAPYNRTVWKDFIKTQFTNNQLTKDDYTLQLGKSDLYTECYSLGNYVVDDFTKIGIFEIQLASKVNLSRNRVALRNLVKEVSAQVAGAMVVFVQDDKWRFSYISKRKVKNKNTNQIEDKETAPKRYTYLFGKNEKALTAAIRFDKLIQKQQDSIFQFLTLNDFEEAFSVEKLGKEFFKNYKDTYEDFVQFLTGKRYAKKGNKYIEQIVQEADWQLTALFDKEDKQARDFCKRMMGRIVFLYFIQKKGWLAVPSGKKWGEGNQNYLYELFKNSKNKDDFYYQELVPLFFKTLNNPDSENKKNDFRFPYLNGGLFDDSHDRKFNKLHLPEHIFSNLFETFNNYNFTVYEDAPDEHTVAVDPEMLGHIFENLLEDNKAKGAFYTPKEIVHYMCKESLKAYLVSQDIAKITDNEFANNTIDKILFQNELDIEEKQFAEKNAYKIIDALEQVKICDPAIGSGAFPMGMLLEIFNTQVYLQELKGFKKDVSDADIKKHIIEESIYGVDIDPGAVDISRLRFWLSLVVDEPVPQPLPNLDFKIVCANTLIPLGNIEELDLNDKAGKAVKELEKLRHEFFNVSSENKLKLERQFNKIQIDLLSLRELATKSNYDIYTKLYEFNPFEDNSCSWFDAEWMFGIRDGFDIVIGNPPYGAKLSKAEKDLFKKTYSDVHMRTPDTFNYFISKSFKILKDNGVLSFIVPNNLLFQNENTKTRSLLVNTYQLKSVTNLGDNAFENADVPTCIFVGVKANNTSYNIYYNDSRKERIDEIDFYKPKKAFSNTDVNDAPDMVLGISSEEIKLMKAIKSNSWTIDDIALEMASGISTGGDKIFRVEEHFAIDYNFEEELLRPVLVGGEIDKYKINDTNHLIIYTDRNTELKRFKNIYDYLLPHKDKLITRSEAKTGIMPWFSLNRQRYPLLFEEEKIIMRQTSDSIRATLDDKGYYCIDSILVFKINPKIQVSYRYALMMLNSKLNNFIYKIITQEEGRTFAQVKPQNVRKLFIPKITKEEQKVFEILCDYLMFLNDDSNEPIFNHTPNNRIAHKLEDITNLMTYELCFKDHMKENDIDVLQFINPESIENLNSNNDKLNVIKDFYLWFQKPENAVRQRMLLVETRSKDKIDLINKNY